MFDESVSFYHLFPYRSAPPPPTPLFLAPGPPPVDPLLPQGPAPSGVSQIDPLPGPALVQVAVDSGAARGAASGGAASGGAEPGGAGSEGAETEGAGVGVAEPDGVEPGGAASEGAESGGAEPQSAALSGGSAGASPSLSLQQLRKWFVQHARLRGGTTRAGGAGAAGADVPGGSAATGPRDAHTKGTRAAGPGGVAGAGAGDTTEAGAVGAGGAGAAAAGVGGTGAGGAGATGAGVVDPEVGGTVRPRPYFVPLLQQVLGTPSSTGLTPPLLCPPPDNSQPPLQPASRLPAPSPYTEQSGGFTEHCEPAYHLVSPVCTALRAPHLRPPVPGMHAMTLRPSSVPLCVPLPAPPEYSLPEVPDPESDRARAASHTVSRLLATVVTDPSFESAVASALVAELLDFAAACRLAYATALVAGSASASPPSVGGECALGTDVLEDRQEDFECLAAAVPRFASLLLAPKEDPNAPDIPTPRSYAKAITGLYSSQWQAAMDAEMASWKSTSTYINEVPPPGANIVDGMWIFRVKRPPGSPPAFKARYIPRGFSQRQGVDYFQTFFPTPKITTLWVLLHVAAQRDYELHSLDFSTTFLQGSLYEEIWLRRPPGFSESFPAGTQWSLWRPVYGLRQAPREWHDTLRTTLAALRFAPATIDPSLFLRTNTSLPPFYVLVYIDDLVFATADTEALTLVKSELQKRHTCTVLGEQRSYLGLQITQDRARRTITLTQSHMVHQVLQRFGFQFSSPQPTPLSTSHSLSAPSSDESVELPVRRAWGSCLEDGVQLSSPVTQTPSWVDDSATQRSSQGYTLNLGSGSVSWRSTRSSSVLSSSCEAEIYAGAMAAQELRCLTYLLTDLGEQPRLPPVLYVDNKDMIALCSEHRLEHRTKHIALRYFLARELQQCGQLCLAYVATWANTADVFTKALPPGPRPLSPLTTTAPTAAPAYRATMASLRVLAFDHEGRPVQFDTWLDDLQLYLLSDIKDGVSALYDAVVARYSSPSIAALGRLLLPYLFPELSAFATVEDLVSHLRASDARYRAAVPAEFLDKNQPLMFITLYFIVTRLHDSLRSERDHFLSLDPTSLTVDLLEQHLLTAETSAVAVGTARGTPRPPFFVGCSPSPLATSYTSATAADVSVAEDVGAASASAKHRSGKGKGGKGAESSAQEASARPVRTTGPRPPSTSPMPDVLHK
ncbi:unnamed protein product [Closterium sp. NIES-54]